MSLYTRVNAFADTLEDRIAKIPGMAWFHYNTTGHPISWLQHTLLAAAFTSPFVLVGHASLGAGLAFGFYVLREIYGGVEKYRELGFRPAAWKDVVDRTPSEANGWVVQKGLYLGWGVDGFMDCVGPGLLWLLL